MARRIGNTCRSWVPGRSVGISVAAAPGALPKSVTVVACAPLVFFVWGRRRGAYLLMPFPLRGFEMWLHVFWQYRRVFRGDDIAKTHTNTCDE